MSARKRRDEGGFALLAVLLVLLSLLILSTPFLWTAGNADRTSAQVAAETRAELGLDTALRHARHELGRSHAGVDRTRFSDGAEETSPRPEFADPRPPHDDPSGTMWSYEVRDHSGLIDFDSAPPQVLANLLGQATYLTERLPGEETTARSAPAPGFPSRGLLQIGGETLVYGGLDGTSFTGLTRGFLHQAQSNCPPLPAQSHGIGAPVLGFDAWTIAWWRIGRALAPTSGGSLGALADELAPVLLAAAPGLDDALLEDDASLTRERLERAMAQRLVSAFEATVTLEGGVAAGRRWQHATTLLSEFGGEVGGECRFTTDSTRWFAPGTTIRIREGETEVLALVQEVSGNTVRLAEPLPFAFTPGLARVESLARRPVNVNTAPPEVLRALFQNLKLRGRNHRIGRQEALELVARVVEQRPYDGFRDFIERLVLPASGLVPLSELEDLSRAQDDDQRRRLIAEALARRDARAVNEPPIIDADDAQALVINALNPNDSALEFSTMPLSFVSRDLYEIAARAAVNAESGRQQVVQERRQLEWVAPQIELLRVWTFQEDFEEELRGSRAAPGWGTGPITTTVPDPSRGADPPPRASAYFQRLPVEQLADSGERGALGGFEAAGGQFPSRDLQGFVKPWHVRVNESGPRAGRMRHFDRPRSALEGIDLGQRTLELDLQAEGLLETPQAPNFPSVGTPPLLAPFGLSMWVRPQAPLLGTHLLDVSGQNPLLDRVELFVDPATSELVLRVTDGPGDHPATPGFREAAEVRYSDPGGGALPADAWSHVEIDVRGSRPDQLGLRVDGYPVGERPGLTRLSSGLGAGDTVIQVESTEGFPAIGPIQIGEEVIEAVVTGPQTFEAVFAGSGPRAGFGGRLAREVAEYEVVGEAVQALPVAAGLGRKGTDHPAGTPVTIYGYSAPLVTPIPVGEARVTQGIGPFRVGRVVGVAPGSIESYTTELQGLGPAGVVPIQIEIGRGFDTAEGEVTALQLAPVDHGLNFGAEELEDLMSAFSPDGGYAALIQLRLGGLTAQGPVQVEEGNLTEWRAVDTNSLLTGIEIVAYSGVDGDRLQIATWGVDAGELPGLGLGTTGAVGNLGVPGDSNHVFILEWILEGIVPGGGPIGPPPPVPGDGVLQASEFDTALEASLFVVPISLPVEGPASAFAQPLGDVSEFAQIVETGPARGRTEWVRYDDVIPFGSQVQLVRDDPEAIDELYDVLTRTVGPLEVRLQAGGGGGGGDDIEPPALGASAPPGLPTSPGPAAAEPPAASAPAAVAQAGPYWTTPLGLDEYYDGDSGQKPVSDAARTWFQFRGVLGTHSFAHDPGTVVTPVFRVFDTRVRTFEEAAVEPQAALSPSWGWPGADDAVFVVDQSTQDIGLPAVVHRAIRPPLRHVRRNWQPPADLVADPKVGLLAEPTIGVEVGYDRFHHLVALRQPFLGIGIPSEAFTLQPGQGGVLQQYLSWQARPTLDTRTVTRLVKFPSGELPRVVEGATLGSDRQGAEAPAPAIVDELFVDRSRVVDLDRPNATLVLAADLLSGDSALQLATDRIRTPFGEVPRDATNALPASWLPPNGGLLRVGEELIAYFSADLGSGTVLVAPGGRGFLGSTDQPHRVGEPVSVVGQAVVTSLQQAVSADSPVLPVVNVPGFGTSGTARVGLELVHYTNGINGLGMPPGDLPGERPEDAARGGRGIYRGRFGTPAGAHPANTPVVFWPTRHWDRYAARSDAPEQHFFSFTLAQPDAWVRSLAIEHTDPAYPGGRLGILLRTDARVPWSADPEETDGLTLAWLDELGGRPLPIGRQSGEVEARLFVEYQPGSFDPLGPLLHGWKEVPTVEQVVMDYLAPGRVLARSDR